ncbi:class I SAM-dependent methyltransferase [Capilliphycus salinus ALCB114379]|uniref:class I SAM-dependent methyltransferase n=1 Tax=Capilliphycus salinus TaxID=2768948 RepID=UPI0039A65D94
MNLTSPQLEIQAFYDKRTNYDNNLTVRRALRLVELAPQLQPGQRVLDLATGTAIIAIAVSPQVGDEGDVIGVDFSAVMLDQARQKIANAGLNNIQLIEADAEKIDFPDCYFDGIFCSSAIVLFPDIPALLTKGYRWLKPDGFMAFSAYAETSHFTPLIAKVCANNGILLPNLHEPVGSSEKCYHQFQQAGFPEIDIKTEQFGRFLSLDEAKQFWKGTWLHPNGHPLSELTPEQTQNLTAEFQRQIETLATEDGVGLDITMFFAIAHK